MASDNAPTYEELSQAIREARAHIAVTNGRLGNVLTQPRLAGDPEAQEEVKRIRQDHFAALVVLENLLARL